MSLFSNGLPINTLSPQARNFFKGIDADPNAPRVDQNQRGDGKLQASELAHALTRGANYSDAERTFLKQAARVMGVETPSATERTWHERKAAPAKMSTPFFAKAHGDSVIVGDRQWGLFKYSTSADAWSSLARPEGRNRQTLESHKPGFATDADRLVQVGGWCETFSEGSRNVGVMDLAIQQWKVLTPDHRRYESECLRRRPFTETTSTVLVGPRRKGDWSTRAMVEPPAPLSAST